MPESQFFSPFIQKIQTLIPIAQTWRTAAEKVVVSAERALSSQNPNADDRLALSLVSRIFKTSNRSLSNVENYNIAGGSITFPEITKIKKTFQDIRDFLNAVQSNNVGLYEAPTPLPPNLSDALAYANIGSWTRKDTDNDGIYFVKNRVENKANDFIVDIIIHESSHAVGIDHAVIDGKAAYGNLAFKLKTADALNNASSYAWLAYQARKPKQFWLNFN